MSKYIRVFDLINHKEKYDVRVQIFVIAELYIALLAFTTIVAQLFVTRHQILIEFIFWLGLCTFSLFSAELIVRLNENKKAIKIYTNIILTILSIVTIPLGVYISGSITTPCIIFVFAGLALISIMAENKIRLILNSCIIIFCLFYIYMEFNHPTSLHIEKPIYEENLIDWAIVFVIVLIFFNKIISSTNKLLHENTNTIMKQKDELYNMSITDYSTNLYNKKYLYEVLNLLITDLNVNNNSFILIAMDIDYFKLFNDTYGHIEGDICLKHIADTLLDSVDKDKGYVFRFGGEEFIIALRADDFNLGVNVIKRINASLKENKIENAKSPISPFITLSYGIILYDNIKTCSCNVDQLLSTLDNALYKAKENGRNQCFTCDNNGCNKVEL
ncbi:MAG: GGDEF domain-containing protein [Pleomorphochaeta sp.]